MAPDSRATNFPVLDRLSVIIYLYRPEGLLFSIHFVLCYMTLYLLRWYSFPLSNVIILLTEFGSICVSECYKMKQLSYCYMLTMLNKSMVHHRYVYVLNNYVKISFHGIILLNKIVFPFKALCPCEIQYLVHRYNYRCGINMSMVYMLY